MSLKVLSNLLLLIPAWIVAYQFKGKAFQLIIDGHGGDIKGKRPFSAAKIVALVALAIILIVVIVVLVMRK